MDLCSHVVARAHVRLHTSLLRRNVLSINLQLNLGNLVVNVPRICFFMSFFPFCLCFSPPSPISLSSLSLQLLNKSLSPFTHFSLSPYHRSINPSSCLSMPSMHKVSQVCASNLSPESCKTPHRSLGTTRHSSLLPSCVSFLNSRWDPPQHLRSNKAEAFQFKPQQPWHIFPCLV